MIKKQILSETADSAYIYIITVEKILHDVLLVVFVTLLATNLIEFHNVNNREWTFAENFLVGDLIFADERKMHAFSDDVLASVDVVFA